MIKSEVKRILLCIPQTAGDVFIATGIIPGIKAKWPEADIFFATEKRYFDILEGNPNIDHVIRWHESMYNYRNYETWGPQKNTFDIVYTPTTITQVNPGWIHGGHGLYLGYVYSHMCDLDTHEYGSQFLRIDKDDSIDLPDEYITIHAKTNQDPKDYDHLQTVVSRIRGIKLVQIGGKDDTSLQGIDLDLRGSTTPQSLAWVLSKAELHLGLDSFPMHVATYVDTPSIILFGGTYAQQGVLPSKRGLITAIEPDNRFLCPTSCHLTSCAMKERGLDKCINNIPSEKVLQAIGSHIGKKHIVPAEEVTLSAYLIIRNGVKYGFPFQQSIEAAAQVADEVVVIDGGSDDGTLESLELLKARQPKLKVFKTKWDIAGNPTLFGDEKTHARRFCEGTWLLQLDADEIIHEPRPGALKDLIRQHEDAEVLDLAVINFYGDDETIRVEPMSWKWRITKNNPNIVHGVHAEARRVDEQNRVVMDKRISDGCEYIHADSLQVCRHKPVFDLEYEIKHQTLFRDREDEEARRNYVKHLEKLVKQDCVVFHYSWMDLERKKRGGEFWDQTWHGKLQATHNTTEDITRRVEESDDLLVNVDFNHPLKD